MIIEAAIILTALLLILLLCFFSGRLHVALLYLALGLRLTSSALYAASRHWRAIVSAASSLTVMFALMAAYGFGLEALHPLSTLTPLLVCASWLLHGSSIAFTSAGAIWLLHGPLHPAFVISASLLAGAAAWLSLHGARRSAGVALLSSIITLAAPHAASHITVPQLALPPLALLAVVACSATLLATVIATRILLERRSVRESFYASYVSPLAAGGVRVAGGVVEGGAIRIVMLALSDGGKVHVLVSGGFREEFEWKAKAFGDLESFRTTVSREVKKAWMRYLSKGDPQPAVKILLKMLEAGGQASGL